MSKKHLSSLITLLFFSLVTQASTKHFEKLNLTFELDNDWTIRDHAIAELAIYNKRTNEVLVVHKQPLHTFNSEDQIPTSVDEFKSYVKENYLQFQLSIMAPFFENEIEFNKSFKSIGLKGPLIEMSGKIKTVEMDLMMWIPWQGNGAYIFNYITPKIISKDKTDFKKLISRFSITNKEINPFLITNFIEPDLSKEPIIDSQFNTKMNQFKNFFTLNNKELEIQNDENFYSLMLVNMKTGDYISTIPHCFTMSQEQQTASTKAFAEFIIESTLYTDTFISDGEEITYFKGEGVSDEIKQLSIQTAMKKIGSCYHAILIATSNPIHDSTNIKTVYDNLSQHEDPENSIEIKDEDKKTAYANYYITAAEFLEEDGIDAEIFYVEAHKLINSADSLRLLLDQLNNKEAYFKGLQFIEEADPEVKSEPYIKSWQAWFLKQTEAFENAMSSYKELFNDFYTSDEDFFIYIELLAENSRWNDAFIELKQNLEKISKRSTALALMVKFAAYSNNEKAALDSLDLLNKENRLNLENVFDVVDGMYEIEAHDNLFQILDSQIEKHPNHLKLHYYKADIQYSIGQYEDALTSIEKAEKIDPDNEYVKELMKNIQLNVGVGNYQKINKTIEPVAIPKSIKKKMGKLAFANSGDAEHLFYTIGSEYKENEKLKTTYTRKIKINNIKGVENYKTITFDFDESYEDAYINSFQILNQSGHVIEELDIRNVYLSTKQDGMAADDDITINIPVPKLSVNMMIKYQITTQTKAKISEFPFKKHFFLSTYPMAMKTVFVKGDIDKIKSVSKSSFDTFEENNLLSWTSESLTQLTYHPMMPYTENISNWLILSANDKSWQSIGDEYLNLVDKKLNSPISKAKKLAIFSGASNTTEKVIKAAAYIQQNINYQAIEFGTRALVPNTSIETLDKGYGDCKDHAVLLHDLLNSEGIKAQLALVNTSKLINQQTPALDQFDHAVVYVPEIGEGMYIDTTDKELKIDQRLPPQNLIDTKALILEKNNSSFKVIPNSASKDSQIIVERQVSNDLSHLLLTETIQMSGYIASGMRYSLKNNQSAELMQNVQSWISSEYSDMELISFDYYGLSDNQAPLILEMKTKIALNDKITSIPFFVEKNYLNNNVSLQREIPFLLNRPFQIQSTTILDPSIRINENSIETKNNNNEVAEWRLDFNKNEITFFASNNRYEGNSETYNEFVKIIKQGLKSLENIISIENETI